MEVDKFDSELGEVAVTKEKIERKRSDDDDWDKITKNYEEEDLIDEAHFSEIEDLEFDDGQRFPRIKIKIDDTWKRLFFKQGDEARDCFTRLRYRWRAHQRLY